MREVCLLIGRGGRVLWSETSDSPVSLPDSRARWEALWRLRAELEEVAHSHPVGPLGFSAEDETTMAALTAALGRPLRFSVLAPEGLVVREEGRDRYPSEEPGWARRLRAESGMAPTSRSAG
ncbi:MAG TPA: hypothetical protein VLQ93_03325 [Myxococcaceae bacterium]|nr:hypothetical protein [Myxococcaceae bacterium]